MRVGGQADCIQNTFNSFYLHYPTRKKALRLTLSALKFGAEGRICQIVNYINYILKLMLVYVSLNEF
jgi:hypothetical protein